MTTPKRTPTTTATETRTRSRRRDDERGEPPPGRPRRLYRITDFGMRVAAAEAIRLQDLVAQSAVRALADKARS